MLVLGERCEPHAAILHDQSSMLPGHIGHSDTDVTVLLSAHVIHRFCIEIQRECIIVLPLLVHHHETSVLSRCDMRGGGSGPAPHSSSGASGSDCCVCVFGRRRHECCCLCRGDTRSEDAAWGEGELHGRVVVNACLHLNLVLN